ncbi:MAG TPA: hypothetical protein VES67_01665 [Vicinamibacterales bacterium]|nr:hypothetical protein [Vicinamibacterales bacterium]
MGRSSTRLDRAHRQDVVHRDLKPANVMLARDGGPRSGATRAVRTGSAHSKLLDFGLAKWAASERAKSLAAQPTRLDVTAQGTILGTLQYMAPEQVEGKAPEGRKQEIEPERDSERVGVLETDSAEPDEIETNSLSVVKSDISRLPAFSSVCVRLPLFADCAGAMSLEMSLAEGCKVVCLGTLRG